MKTLASSGFCLVAALAAGCTFDASQLRALPDGAAENSAVPDAGAAGGDATTASLPDSPIAAGGSGGTTSRPDAPITTGGSGGTSSPPDAPIATGGSGGIRGSGGLGGSSGGGDAGVPDVPATQPDVPIGGSGDAAGGSGGSGGSGGGIDVCGDGRISGTEQCDDNNTNSGDGCSDKCEIEKGWRCLTPGVRCQAAACGDGLMVGSEACDDGNTAAGDGCSDTCRVEPGYFCPTPGAGCKKTVCGNGVLEGDEGCDDGNKLPWDGCSPTCEREPTCTNGDCVSVCGDGMILAGDVEECDDGNQLDNDGCSHTCTKEPGWDCVVAPVATTNQLSLPVVFRDFISFPATGATRHPNFEDDIGVGVTPGLVKSVLGADSKPVYAGICDNASATGCPYGRQLTTQADFDQWYRDTSVSVRGDSFITLTLNATGQYVFNGGTPAAPFLPFGRNDLTGVGWVAQGQELASGGGDFGFTTELHYWFQLQGEERLDFSGDDDVWVFLRNALLIDLGGRHAQTSGTINLTDTEITTRGLSKGRIYEIALFHAERHTTQSNFQLTLNGFGRSRSVCTPICGDGIVVKGEMCDDGPLNGTYGHCNATCTASG